MIMSSNCCSLRSVVVDNDDGRDPTFQIACLMGMDQVVAVRSIAGAKAS
jgi:hypothetical protein